MFRRLIEISLQRSSLVVVLGGLLTLAAIAQMLFTPMQMQT